MAKQFLIMEFLKHSLLAPVRVGKSYFGVFAFGFGLFIFSTMLSYLLSIVISHLFEGGYAISVNNQYITDLYFLPVNLIYGIYDKLWLALILIVLMKTEKMKYILPHDIWQTTKLHFKQVLIFSFMFTLILALGEMIVNYINIDWLDNTFTYFIWPMIMVCFIVGIVSICLHCNTIKKAFMNIGTFLNQGNIFGIISIYIFYLISNLLPGKLMRLLMEPFYSRYTGDNADKIDFFFRSINVVSQLTVGIIEVLFLTILLSAAIYCFRIIKSV